MHNAAKQGKPQVSAHAVSGVSGHGQQPGMQSGWTAEPFSSFDAFPVLSQAKSAYQWLCNDEAGARLTWERCKVFGPFISQAWSLMEYYNGYSEQAMERQYAFFTNFKSTFVAAAESLPIAAPFLASAHACSGDRKRAEWIGRKACRSCLVVTAGGTVCAAGGPALASSSSLIAVAAGAGTLTGIMCDAFLVPRPSVPRPLTPGQRFDWAAVRFLDALRAMAGFDLVLVFWPERASQISVWIEPISVGDAARLAMGQGTSADAAVVASPWKNHLFDLDKFPSGVDHVFVMWKTNKGHLFVSERLHDGRVLVEDLHNGTMLPFAHGKALPTEDLHRAAGGVPGHGGHGHGAGPSAAGSQATLATTAAEAAKQISDGKAQLFSEHTLQGGPSVVHFLEVAKAKSAAGYDLMQANCQHYAQDVWNFAVGHRLGMPNQDFLNIFQLFGAPARGATVTQPGVLGNALYALRDAGAWRLILDAALVKLPVLPAHVETEVEAPRTRTEDSRVGGRAGGRAGVESAPPQRERTWV